MQYWFALPRSLLAAKFVIVNKPEENAKTGYYFIL